MTREERGSGTYGVEDEEWEAYAEVVAESAEENLGDELDRGADDGEVVEHGDGAAGWSVIHPVCRMGKSGHTT